MPNSLQTHELPPPGSSVHGILQQEYWSGLPFPSPGDLPHPGIKPESPALTGKFFTTESAGKPQALGRDGEIGIWPSLEGYNEAALLHSAGPQGQKQWQTDTDILEHSSLSHPSWASCPAPPCWPFAQGTWSSIHLPNQPPSEKKHCYKWSLWFFKVWGWNSLCSEPFLSHPPPGCPLIMVNSSIFNMKGHYLEPSGKLPGHMVTEGCGSGHTPWSALNLFSEEVMARDRKYFGQLFPQCTEALVGSTVVIPSVDDKLIYPCADKIFAKHWHRVEF